VGLQPRTKGLDRVLAALAANPGACLLVCGVRAETKSAAEMRRLARRLGVAGRVSWLGYLNDGEMRAAMAAADVLVHPSRADVAGMVILEAMVGGVPVITTEVCGYAEHVLRADAGIVLAEPFDPAALAAAVASATSERLALWSANARAYTQDETLFSGIARAADLIEEPLP
jgi:UDP-glucose:(heptosyl)LPS alpha-1,3-glucosyltransferase